MGRLLLILAIITIPGCGDSTVDVAVSDASFYVSEVSFATTEEGTPPADGYRQDVMVRLHFMSVEQIRELAAEDRENVDNIWGLAVPNSDGTCDIYIEHPSSWDDYWRMQILGHETMHCIGMPTHGG